MWLNNPWPDYDDQYKNQLLSAESPEAIKEVKEHVEKMKVPADDTKTKCVDGWYRENESVWAIAFAWWDLWLSMALLGMWYTPEEAFQLVYDFKISCGETYDRHSDTHEWDGDCVVWCGHCNAAIKHAEKFWLDSDAVSKLLDTVKAKQETDPDTMWLVRLDRKHKEKAILVILDKAYTVKPRDQTEDNQYFIYDQTRHHDYLGEFVKYCKWIGVDIDLARLIKISDKHTNATLGLLSSSKGKPLYTTKFDEQGQAVVEFAWYAPIICE